MNTTGRISISRKDESTSILIFPYRDRQKENVLGLWLLAWFISGLIIAFYSFTASLTAGQKIFILVWFVFWFYFLWLGGYAWFWRRKGVERLLIKQGKLYYRKELARKGKSHIFDLDMISDLRLHIPSEKSFLEQITSSYWYVGGETVSFRYFGKLYRIGQQLPPNEQQVLIRILHKEGTGKQEDQGN